MKGMETNLKKALSMIGVVCFSITSLFAGQYDDEHQDRGHHHAKSAVPPATQPGEDSPTVFVTADYTYWVARQGGLAYAISNDYTAAAAGVTRTRGSVFYPDWKGRSGFKVGLGAYLNHDGWDMYAQYTWFYNKQQENKYGSNANFTAGQGFSTWWIDDANNFVMDGIDEASTFWANWFNRVDVQLARSHYAGHYLQMRPYMGILGAWDEQWYNIRYKVNAADPRPDTWENNQKWWGVGPWGGVCNAFMFPMGDSQTHWSLFMDMGIALPWSKVQADLNLKDGATAALLSDAYTRNTYWTIEPMLEMALGLRWETWWTEGMNWNFMLQAAWEQQVWFAHNYMQPIGAQGLGGNGNYIMQGLTIKAKVGF